MQMYAPVPIKFLINTCDVFKRNVSLNRASMIDVAGLYNHI